MQCSKPASLPQIQQNFVFVSGIEGMGLASLVGDESGVMNNITAFGEDKTCQNAPIDENS